MKNKLDNIKKMLKKPCYIGEDGAMATICKTKRGAWVKFRKQVRSDCGDYEANEVDINDIVVGHARIPTKDDIDTWGDESEFFVGSGKTLNSIECWFYNI